MAKMSKDACNKTDETVTSTQQLNNSTTQQLNNSTTQQ